jgi:hypothetical protein
MTNPTPHPLAATIMEWAKDMQVDKSIVWQCLARGSVYWTDCYDNPGFNPAFEYRRKPIPARSREVVVNGQRVMRGVWEAPEVGEVYWVPAIGLGSFAFSLLRGGVEGDNLYFSRGLVYRSDERHLAEAMARAMLAPLVGEDGK